SFEPSASRIRRTPGRRRATDRNQRFFSRPRPAFQLPFPFERLRLRDEWLEVRQRHRPPAGGVARAATAVVHLGPADRVARVAGVQRAVLATNDINEIHAAILSAPLLLACAYSVEQPAVPGS